MARGVISVARAAVVGVRTIHVTSGGAELGMSDGRILGMRGEIDGGTANDGGTMMIGVTTIDAEKMIGCRTSSGEMSGGGKSHGVTSIGTTDETSVGTSGEVGGATNWNRDLSGAAMARDEIRGHE